MSLYICISEVGKKDIIILNSKYSRRELADELRSTKYEHRVCTILDEGRELQKNLKIKCRNEGRITTEEEGFMYFFYKGDTVIVYPNGTFCVKPSILRRIFG